MARPTTPHIRRGLGGTLGGVGLPAPEGPEHEQGNHPGEQRPDAEGDAAGQLRREEADTPEAGLAGAAPGTEGDPRANTGQTHAHDERRDRLSPTVAERLQEERGTGGRKGDRRQIDDRRRRAQAYGVRPGEVAESEGDTKTQPACPEALAPVRVRHVAARRNERGPPLVGRSDRLGGGYAAPPAPAAG